MMQETEHPINTAKKISWRLIISLCIFVCIVLLLWWITDEIVLENESGFDASAFTAINEITDPATTKLMLLFTFFGSTKFLFPAYSVLALLFLFRLRNRFHSISVAVVGLSSIGLLYLLKNIFRRHRPPEPLTSNVIGYSYPSGHSFSSFTFCGLLIYIIWKTNLSLMLKWIISIFLFLFAFMIAFSRVYLHVHYASDVLAGFLLSVIWLSICYYLFRKFRPESL